MNWSTTHLKMSLRTFGKRKRCSEIRLSLILSLGCLNAIRMEVSLARRFSWTSQCGAGACDRNCKLGWLFSFVALVLLKHSSSPERMWWQASGTGAEQETFLTSENTAATQVVSWEEEKYRVRFRHWKLRTNICTPDQPEPVTFAVIISKKKPVVREERIVIAWLLKICVPAFLVHVACHWNHLGPQFCHHHIYNARKSRFSQPLQKTRLLQQESTKYRKMSHWSWFDSTQRVCLCLKCRKSLNCVKPDWSLYKREVTKHLPEHNGNKELNTRTKKFHMGPKCHSSSSSSSSSSTHGFQQGPSFCYKCTFLT